MPLGGIIDLKQCDRARDCRGMRAPTAIALALLYVVVLAVLGV